MVILGLGSNVGDRLARLQEAVTCLAPLLGGLRVSYVLESTAVLPSFAPSEWNMPFYNMAVAGEYTRSPQALLTQVKAIEQAMGRMDRGRWGPREIDIDILAMGDTVLESTELRVPHADLLNRDFALLPLAELAPDWRYPVGEYKGLSVRDIVARKGYAAGPQLMDKGMLVHAN